MTNLTLEAATIIVNAIELTPGTLLSALEIEALVITSLPVSTTAPLLTTEEIEELLNMTI